MLERATAGADVPHGEGRDAWLDWLRAGAISSVMLYHVLQMSPGARWGWSLARHGTLGVDLFFVLSGWLIGGLYWRERQRTGQVMLLRFWQRRWWRTVPPYFVALLLSWAAVFVARRESFDPGYLLFFQNYYQRVPFFLVSWSLCIEEHFYLFVPLLVSLAFRFSAPTHAVFAALLVSPLVFRWLAMEPGHDSEFGFYQTATHLRLDGLIMGFWASAVAADGCPHAGRIRRIARWTLPAGVAFVVWAAVFASARARYVWLPLSAGGCFLALLLSGVGRRSAARAPRIPYLLANAAYSLYLTHPLAIHAARLIASRLAGPGAAAPYYAAVVLVIATFGTAFFLLVERPSTRLRERWAPKPLVYSPSCSRS